MNAAIGLCRARKSLIECHSFYSSPCKLPYYKKVTPLACRFFMHIPLDIHDPRLHPSPCAKYKIPPFLLLRDGFSGLQAALPCARYKTLQGFVFRASDTPCISHFHTSPTPHPDIARLAPIYLPCPRHKQTPQSIYVATAFPPYSSFSCPRHAWVLRLVYIAGDLCPAIYPITHRQQSAAITEIVPGSCG